MHSLITDLALIVLVASVAILFFKWLKQPVVLGYIIAGFLVGPHMQLLPTVANTDAISTWAEIGVVFLMFSLGLDFSLKKFVKGGRQTILVTIMTMSCMMAVGNAVGAFFGWGVMNSLFLGASLTISSSTIIYKALQDLGMSHYKFADSALSVSILQDIGGILLMVILSTIAVSQSVEGGILALSLLKIAFFVTICFLVGIYIIPIFFRYVHRWLNKEALLLVSVGFCFLLVLVAEKFDYSSAFGAFIMGSILSETLEAENIGEVLSPLRDLFGAIFFVSVGMMVDPAILVEYWLPIVTICLSLVIGQMIFGTTSFLITGSTLKNAIRSGFSITQIGEISFIIAQLGITLKVIDDFFYPVTVAVCVITTFFTPYSIRVADPAYRLVTRILPNNLVERLDAQKEGQKTQTRSLWRTFLTAIFSQVMAYATLTVASIGISLTLFLPLCRTIFSHWLGNIICGVGTLIIIAPFLRAIVMRKHHNEVKKKLAHQSRLNSCFICIVFALRYAISTTAIYYLLNYLSPLDWWIHILAALIVMTGLIASRKVKYRSIRLERTFMQNLGTRERIRQANRPAYAGGLQSRDIHISSVMVPAESTWSGRPLRDLSFSRDLGVMVAAIIRGNLRMNIPDGETLIFPGDILEIISDDNGIQTFSTRLESEIIPASNTGSQRLLLRPLIIATGSPFCGKTLSESGIRDNYQCMVVGFEDTNDSLNIASAEQIITHGDKLWIVGEENSLRRIQADNHAPSIL